ncbi:MAG: hypothetical protein IPP48_15365 [Chitinophagaceae bacterium]|nr:hypothetical protein [Chitinophagaceae bacterium]
MKQNIIVLIIFIFTSCTRQPKPINETTSADTNYVNTVDTSSKSNIQNTSLLISPLVWDIDFFGKTKTKNTDFKTEQLNTDSLIKALNDLYPEIQLSKVKMSGDTLFTQIKNSEYLTNNMGSSGTATYIADVVINLTTIKEIKCVIINFKLGSHATPDIWCRDDFADYKIIR